MSNLHQTATRVVTLALIPATLAVSAAVAWSVQPPALTGVRASIRFDVSMHARAEPHVTIGEITFVRQPVKPRHTPEPVPEVKRVCEHYPLYASGTERVLICTRADGTR